MRKILILVVLLVGCSSTRYPGWEHVRIEYSTPDPSCEYKIQEACNKQGADCFNFYKKRATKYGANTVFITNESRGVAGKSSAIVLNGAGGAGASVRSDITALADYYYCPRNPAPPKA